MKMKANKDYSLEFSDSRNHYIVRILSGKYATVVFYFDTVYIKKRWLRDPKITFTYKIISDAYGEISDLRDFEEVAGKILEVEFFTLS